MTGPRKPGIPQTSTPPNTYAVPALRAAYPAAIRQNIFQSQGLTLPSASSDRKNITAFAMLPRGCPIDASTRSTGSVYPAEQLPSALPSPRPHWPGAEVPGHELACRHCRQKAKVHITQAASTSSPVPICFGGSSRAPSSWKEKLTILETHLHFFSFLTPCPSYYFNSTSIYQMLSKHCPVLLHLLEADAV